jgi:hypothetical protein
MNDKEAEEMKTYVFAAITTIIDTSRALAMMIGKYEIDSKLNKDQLEFVNNINLECTTLIDKERLRNGNME